MKNIKSNTFLKTLATAAGEYIGFYDEKNKKFIETSV